MLLLIFKSMVLFRGCVSHSCPEFNIVVVCFACGYALANQGMDTRLIQDYLGHRNIRHTVLYTASNVERFRKVWQNQPVL